MCRLSQFNTGTIADYMLILMLAAFLVVSSTSCSRRQDVDDILSEAFNLANEGRYDEAQMKALEVEELLTDDASLENRESLARLYGLIFF